ncbi:MAG: esterase family protein [Clostridia bacterium]|nr:esterase family protein [Clostridia bacterium]
MALIHIGFFSESLGMCVACDVILPQKASSGQIGMASGTRGDKHPVLWLLHGASDNHTIWQRRTSIERYAAQLGLAVVMPNAHLSSYADMAHGGKYYTYISKELPEKMRSFFPLSDKREDNYSAGLSMGGAGCLKIGLANPDKYAAIGCLSAGASNMRPAFANDPVRKARQERVYGDRVLEGTEEDTLGNASRLVKAGGPFPRISHACGESDFLLENAHATRDFFQSIPGNPFDYTYLEAPGAHTWEFWDEHIQDFLKYLKLTPLKDIRN